MQNNLTLLLEYLLTEQSFIDEMPIGKVHRIGDFNKSSSIRNPVDRALLSNPKAEVKMRKIWQNTKGNFDLVFVNDPRVNKSEFREIGPVDLDFVRNKMKLSEQELPIDPNATTIIYTNNSGDQRVMSSPWILSHRLGHAINRAREGTSNDYLATLWREFTQKLAILFKDMLHNVYNLSTTVRGLTGPNTPLVDQEEMFKLTAASLGTMKSARENKLRSWYEFAYELFSQYLLFGKIKLNQIPDSILTKVRGFVKQSKRVYDKDAQEMYNRHDLQYYVEELESTLDYLIEELSGTIFVM